MAATYLRRRFLPSKTVVVAGAGVVGLSIARAAARQGADVLVLEKNARVGQETSARNSEVVHAGIYYATTSWKARLCVPGRQQLYDFCKAFHVPVAQCGKLIVAHAYQHTQLQSMLQQGLDNGVQDLQLITRSETQAMEPNVHCHEAIWSPSTGIVDSHALLQALQGDAEAHGMMLARATAVCGGTYDSKAKTFVIQAMGNNGESEQEVECDYFVNATGMFAPELVDKIVSTDGQHFVGRPLPRVPERFAKGTYFKLSAANRPFRRLVYPIPEVGGLGVHATIDLAGNVRFGPDVEWVDRIDYQPDLSRAEHFAERIRAYWPGARAELLEADYCGIRPKITIDGKIVDDFYIAVRLRVATLCTCARMSAVSVVVLTKACQDERVHGIPGLVHLCGIESPGLTASFAIADVVVSKLLD